MGRGEEISKSQRRVSDRLSSKLRSHHPNILRMPNHSSDEEDHYLPPPAAMSSAYLYKADEIKLIVQGTIKAFLSLHDLEMSLLRFDASNIFWSVKDRELKLGGLVLIDASPGSKKMDFQFLARAVKELFRNRELPLMYMENVIDLMDNFREGDGDLLLNHMALKPVSERLAFISDAYEKRNFLTPESKNIYFRDVVDNMSRSSTNSEDWRTTIVDKPQAVFDCFNHKPRAEPAHYENTNLHILRFSRNMAKHLREHLIKYKDKGFQGTVDEIDSIIINMFGDELLSFQKLAYDHGILKDIMPGYISRNSSSQQKEGTPTPPQNSTTIHEDNGEMAGLELEGRNLPHLPAQKKIYGRGRRG